MLLSNMIAVFQNIYHVKCFRFSPAYECAVEISDQIHALLGLFEDIRVLSALTQHLTTAPLDQKLLCEAPIQKTLQQYHGHEFKSDCTSWL